MTWIVGRTTISLVKGDIAGVSADAIVNAANAHLAGGGGVDGAIHRAGGPEIMAACRQIGGCPTGSAVATTAGKLNAKHVIHAVAPRWHGGTKSEESLLSGAYRTALRLAEELEDRAIAFPSLGTGAYGYPVAAAASVALLAVRDHASAPSRLKQVLFVLFSDSNLGAYERAAMDVLAVPA